MNNNITIWKWFNGSIAVLLGAFIHSTAWSDVAVPLPQSDYPSASPTGGKVVFASNITSDNSTIWVVDRKSSHMKPLVNWPDSTQTEPDWSPDGAYIIFTSTHQSEHRDIWKIDADGNNPIRLTFSGDNRRPRFTHNGKEIIYKKSLSRYKHEHWSMLVDGSDNHKIEIPSYIKNPIWSPDNTSIVFRECSSLKDIKSYQERVCDLFTYNISTDVKKQITNLNTNVISPDWGPLGITFVANQGESAGIWIVDEFGDKPRKISKGHGFYQNPRWDKSTNTILFSKADIESTDIWEIDLDGFETRMTTSKAANQAPIANAGDDRNIECTSTTLTSTTLDGSLSYDPDSDPLTYAWNWESDSVAGINPIVSLPLGENLITLMVTDTEGVTDTDSVVVSVNDTTPPTIQSASATPSKLWPVNHKMVEVVLSANTSDICSNGVSCRVASISSNEPINGIGDGNNEVDWIITGDLSVQLRAERSGKGSDRIYTLGLLCTDNSLNTSFKDVYITVPHNQ